MCIFETPLFFKPGWTFITDDQYLGLWFWKFEMCYFLLSFYPMGKMTFSQIFLNSGQGMNIFSSCIIYQKVLKVLSFHKTQGKGGWDIKQYTTKQKPQRKRKEIHEIFFLGITKSFKSCLVLKVKNIQTFQYFDRKIQ